MDEIIKRIEYLLELLQMSQEEVVIWRKETFGQDNIGVDCIDSYRCGYTESALRGILEMMKGDANEKREQDNDVQGDETEDGIDTKAGV